MTTLVFLGAAVINGITLSLNKTIMTQVIEKENIQNYRSWLIQPLTIK